MAIFPNLCVRLIRRRRTRNTQCIPACPVGLADRTGVVIIFAFLDLEKNISFLGGHYLREERQLRQA